MFSFLKLKKKQAAEAGSITDFSFLGCDMHSHLLPGIDDGAQEPRDSLDLIRAFKAAGFTKLVTTPHVFGDYYPNSSAVILDKLAHLNEYLVSNDEGIEIRAAAEYYLDQYFLNKVLPHGLLSFGNQYVLVETSMAGHAIDFDECLFAIQAKGYTPVLAHIERYTYITDPRFYNVLKERGILLQLNALSMVGYYGETVRKLAKSFLEAGLYDFCGTDIHHSRQAATLHAMEHRHPEAYQLLTGYGKFKNSEL